MNAPLNIRTAPPDGKPSERAAAPRAGVVDVLVPVALDQAYSYRVPETLTLMPGDVVRVPLGPRETIGVVWDSDGPAGRGDNLKPVIARLDVPPMRAEMRKFVDWVARYTLSPRGMVARMALRDPEGAAPERPRLGVRATGQSPSRPTPARQRVMEVAEGGMLWRKSALANAASVSAGVIDGLVDDGALATVLLPPDAVSERPDPQHAQAQLSAGQAAAAATLGSAVAAEAFSTTLLEGVTGSGKTEVYFEAVAAALRRGRQALILMPEIALTAQFLARFEARFGVCPAEWHSGVAETRRNRLFASVAAGETQVVVGARSALFLPFSQLGLIVVDEEHEAAYKQEDGVHYHARDMAIVRGRLEKAAVVLASATPSIESQVNAASGRYGHARLPDRHGGRNLPAITAIDLRSHAAPRGRWIAPALVNDVRATLERGEQVLLFLNRRGYAPLTLCRACGHRWQCPNCSTSLVEHRFRRSLLCHQCGHIERVPQACTQCHTADNLAPIGPGVERLADEVAELFPSHRCIMLSSDFPGGTQRLRSELDAVAKGTFPLVIGTQLVAKGHNFPLMTLAAVIDADVGLMNGDPRAAERSFQLLQQVTGRAGRGERAGRGVLQTWQPEHPVMRAMLTGDSARFYAEEIAARQRAGLPPFGRLVGLVISAAEKPDAENHARALVRAGFALQQAAPERYDAITLLGPAEAPVAMVRGRHRFRLLLKAPREADAQGFCRAMLSAVKPRGSVRVQVDVDPVSFM